MNVLLILLALTTVALVSVLRTVVADDPRRTRGYAPPRSHHVDAFEPTGSSYR